MSVDFISWYQRIVFHEKYVTLPNGRTISKEFWIKPDGFDTEGFRKHLMAIYEAGF